MAGTAWGFVHLRVEAISVKTGVVIRRFLRAIPRWSKHVQMRTESVNKIFESRSCPIDWKRELTERG
jgi:hypothetical protein